MQKPLKPLKAILFDLDGTAIPIAAEGMPSDRVKSAVRNAQQSTFVSVATGRDIAFCEYLLDIFAISHLSILSGGTELYDPKSKQVVWEQALTQAEIETVLSLIRHEPYAMVNDQQQVIPLAQFTIPEKAHLLCIRAVDLEGTKRMKKLLSALPIVVTHAVPSWTSGKFDFHVTHHNASKQHALEELLRRESLVPAEVMVVGDSANDLPLFAVGCFNVAMGNASAALKEQADWIAPSISEDGLAVAIETHVLQN